MRFALLILVASLAFVMSRPPQIENLSCRFLVAAGSLSDFKTCAPCWEQSQWTRSFYKSRGLSTIGTCFRLYPSKVEGWEAVKPDGKYWSDKKWKGLVTNGKNNSIFKIEYKLLY
jgi:hypothetical protein